MWTRVRYLSAGLSLATLLLLPILAVACSSAAATVTTSSGSRWASQPDHNGRYYAGNASATLVIEEWSDVQ